MTRKPSRRPGSRHPTSIRRRGIPSKQHYPSWSKLLERIDAGLSPRKEVLKRIQADEIPAEDENPEEFEAYEQVTMLLGALK